VLHPGIGLCPGRAGHRIGLGQLEHAARPGLTTAAIQPGEVGGPESTIFATGQGRSQAQGNKGDGPGRWKSFFLLVHKKI
jgi:hypothetical protein